MGCRRTIRKNPPTTAIRRAVTKGMATKGLRRLHAQRRCCIRLWHQTLASDSGNGPGGNRLWSCNGILRHQPPLRCARRCACMAAHTSSSTSAQQHTTPFLFLRPYTTKRLRLVCLLLPLRGFNPCIFNLPDTEENIINAKRFTRVYILQLSSKCRYRAVHACACSSLRKILSEGPCSADGGL